MFTYLNPKVRERLVAEGKLLRIDAHGQRLDPNELDRLHADERRDLTGHERVSQISFRGSRNDQGFLSPSTRGLQDSPPPQCRRLAIQTPFLPKESPRSLL